ncbi:MAG: oligosaccharide flippase family protein, partial [Pseudomonadota bacterium]|nr:oligosaccharide flippase family protein [Pseudomonadota bacterium]
GSAFAMNVVIARQLGADEAGLFFLAYTIVFVAAAVSRLGLDNTFVRFIAAHQSANEWAEINGLYKTGVRWALFASLVVAACFWILAEPLAARVFTKPAFADVLRVMALAIPFLALFTLHASALQGIKRIPQSMIVLSVASPLAVVALAFAVRPEHAETAGWLVVAATALTLVLGGYWWKQIPDARGNAIRVGREKILASCLPLLGVVVLNQTVNWSSQIMLGAWATSADVALFNAAQRTAMLTSFVLVAVNSIAAPKFAAMFRMNQHDALRRTAKHATRLMIILALAPLALMLAFPDLILLLFGAEFTAGATSLQILAIGQFINVATGSVGFLLAMTGHERLLRNNVLAAATVALALGFGLIPSYGLVGAAIATAVGVATQNLLSAWQVRRVLGFNTLAVWR